MSRPSRRIVTHADNSVLIHHGVKGMKWGVRRYQNSDGSLTEAGKKRYSRDSVDAKHKSARAFVSDTQHDIAVAKQRLDYVADDAKLEKRSNVKKASNGIEKIDTGVNRIANESRVSNRYANNHKTLSAEEMAQLSDKELQQLVNRLNMETNYTRLTEEPRFIDRVATGLTYAAAISTVAIGALNVYAALRDLNL